MASIHLVKNFGEYLSKLQCILRTAEDRSRLNEHRSLCHSLQPSARNGEIHGSLQSYNENDTICMKEVIRGDHSPW